MMRLAGFYRSVQLCLVLVFAAALTAQAQTGSSATINGTVTDPSGAVVAGAAVTIHNPVSGYMAAATTDKSGTFRFENVPFNPYHMTVTAAGFSAYVEDVEVRSGVPVNLKIKLALAGSSTTVTVEAPHDLLENTSTDHTDISRQLFARVPLESQSSSLSSLVTLTSPGIVADSNGLFHGLGDHASNSFSVDGQPITDQQSKVFSNQLPADAVQSMEVIQGAPPAEYGDKTSVVINVTTRSGQGVTTPHGSVSTSYGSFGTGNLDFDLAYGGQKWGNFIAANVLNTGRFLDPAEFAVMHDKGNQENIFDRVDYQFTPMDTAHLNLNFTRSWFQTPNSIDAQLATAWNGVVVSNGGLDPNGQLVGPTDQRSQIRTFDIAPSWDHILNPDAVLTVGAYVRRDQYDYYPSGNPFADLQPFLQSESAAQGRFLTNAGARVVLSYVKGINNVKAGVNYSQTFLSEHDNFGIVDPTFLASLTDASGNSCLDAMGNPIAPPCTTLAPYDLTRGGTIFGYFGHADIKQFAAFAEDTIRAGNWSFNLGMRGDIYNGITSATQAEPRAGIAYNVKRTNTVLRVSYARTLETPFNENLVISSTGCSSPILNPLLACSSSANNPLPAGFRNEFHAGLQQAFGRHIVFDGEYIWKYTHNAYDFSVFGNTPITFPIAWHNSKIPGFAARVNVTNIHGFTAYLDFAGVAARFFTPQIGGAGAGPSGVSVFRIDHDEAYEQTFHMQYQPWKQGPWLGFNWRYDSGLVAGPVPCAGGNCNNGPLGTLGVVDVSGLSADQQSQAGLACNGVPAAPPTSSNPIGTPISSPLGTNLCPASEYTSSLVSIPAPGTENDDHNPPRIAGRSLFDLAIGDDNIFHGERYQWSARVTAVNLANNYALYNFLSTFSGTHYVTPRTFTAQIGFHF